MVVADDETAAEALPQALRDDRAEVRSAAAETIARRAAPGEGSPVATAVAEALVAEGDRHVLRSLLLAVVAVADQATVEPLTLVLAQETIPPEAESAAEALATRFPDACRVAWTHSPARAERRWARALTAAARSRGRAPRAS
jgi:hypothetical protein